MSVVQTMVLMSDLAAAAHAKSPSNIRDCETDLPEPGDWISSALGDA
jgi:hypothetical protein